MKVSSATTPQTKAGMSKIPVPNFNRIHSLSTPWGRIMFTKDPGHARIGGKDMFATNTFADIYEKATGKHLDRVAFGSGVMTNAFVDLWNSDQNLGGAFPYAALYRTNYHALGNATSPSAALSSDVALQSQDTTHITGGTNGYFTGTISQASPNVWQSVSPLISFGSSTTITETSISASNLALVTATATSATNNTLTASAAAWTTNLYTGQMVVFGNPLANQPTTTKMGTILSNTGTVLTIVGAAGVSDWVTQGGVLQGNPASFPTTITIANVMMDRHVWPGSGVSVDATIQLQITVQL